MISTKSKIKILEYFYAIDRLFFGRDISSVKTECCPLLKEDYITLKGALLSTIIEMSKLVKHEPKMKKKNLTEADLRISATEMAKNSRKNALKIISTKKGVDILKENTKNMIMENKKMGIVKATQKAIMEKVFEVAIDNLIIANTLKESKMIDKLNDIDGQIIEGAYKIVRTALVERARDILDSMK